MVEMETFELWVSSEVPLVQEGEDEEEEEEEGSSECHRSMRTEAWLWQTAAEPEQQEANMDL